MNGLTIAIEPMINMGTHKVKQLSDNWTIVTEDGLPSAHFEHDIAVVDGEPIILSTFDYIEEALDKM
jgi:methionyl aminopeptidase